MSRARLAQEIARGRDHTRPPSPEFRASGFPSHPITHAVPSATHDVPAAELDSTDGCRVTGDTLTLAKNSLFFSNESIALLAFGECTWQLVEPATGN